MDAHFDGTTDRVSDERTVSEAVVAALAEAEGVEVTDLDVRLYDVVEPEALDSLFRSAADGTPRTDGRIVFGIARYEVVVHSDGGVEVSPADDRGGNKRSSSGYDRYYGLGSA